MKSREKHSQRGRSVVYVWTSSTEGRHRNIHKENGEDQCKASPTRLGKSRLLSEVILNAASSLPLNSLQTKLAMYSTFSIRADVLSRTLQEHQEDVSVGLSRLARVTEDFQQVAYSRKSDRCYWAQHKFDLAIRTLHQYSYSIDSPFPEILPIGHEGRVHASESRV